jgi:NHL repeat
VIAHRDRTNTHDSTLHKEPARMNARRTSTAIAALACALVAYLALAVAPAAAKVIHNQEGSFDGSDAPGGSFTAISMNSVAVDNTAAGPNKGDVYVLEAEVFGLFGHSVVDKFDEKGKYAGVQISGAETPQKSFAFADAYGPPGVSGVAVDNTAAGSNEGDVYVADTEHGVIDRFGKQGSEEGKFLCQITAKPALLRSPAEAAAECNGAAGSEVTGTPSIEPAGVAVASNGDLYVADEANNAIDIFGPSGEYKSQIKDPHLGTGHGFATIALDSAGDLYVTNFGHSVVEFDSSGHFVETIEQGNANGVAVDNTAAGPDKGNVYISDERARIPGNPPESAIADYEPSATGDVLLDVFAYNSESNTSMRGLAVGPTGKLYAGKWHSGVEPTEVAIYGPDVVIPTVTTEAATNPEETSAMLHGHLDPDTAHGGGPVESCRFEYGPTKAYGETAPCSPGPPYSSEDVNAELKGLRPFSTYHFRLEAANSNGGPSTGEDETLTTKGPPTVDHETAEGRTTSVVFLAKINPGGYDTTCQVQYVPNASFQESKWANATTVPCQPEDLGSGSGEVRSKFQVTGLAREAMYHYRFLVSNQAGLSGYPDRTFETYGIDGFSIEEFKNSQINANSEWTPGEPETHQAGAHPYELVTTIQLSRTTLLSENLFADPPEEVELTNWTGINTKDIHTDLPPGLIGNPNATPKCNRYLVNAEECPGDTMVGRIELWLDGNPSGGGGGAHTLNRPPDYDSAVYNLTPSGQYPAEFGAFIEGQTGAWIGFHVRTGGDYGVTADAINIVGLAVPEKIRVRVWGVPADPAHDVDRVCPNGSGQKVLCPSDQPLKPLLTNPTSCTGPQTATATADSWQEPGTFVKASTEVPGFTGCDKLKFEPTLEAQPTSNLADSPTGLNVDLHVPQPEACKEEAGQAVCENAEADLKDATVRLPAGLAVDPSQADGLQVCSEAQIGYLAQKSAEVGRPQFTPTPAECPDASKVGSVEVDSPLVDHPLPGAVYVAAQDANPFKSLLALYVTVYDAQTGVVVKLPGKVALDPVTGQLTTTVDQDPQLPFGDFKLDFFPGSRGALTTPLVCGSYALSTDLTPWSSPEGADATPSSLPFAVTGPAGSACVSSESQAPNSPGFEAGTASPIAATYSPFVLALKREDGSQRFSGLNVTLPPGLTGKIAGLEECPQAAIEAARARGHEGEGGLELAHPSCPAGSEVGSVHVGAGSGAPDYVTGHAYFAGPYNGAPFSLVIVTPAVAGPFDLGTVVVRAGLYIDPSTAQVTVKSDPFPTILDGIPLDIRSVNVEMNRKEFTLNPTSCSVMSVTGQESSTASQTVALSDRFQAGGCTTLPFHPSFTASTSGKNSKAGGASLTVKVAQHPGEANIHKVDLQLPIQLPSRLSTLQKACAAAVFEANPAGCPAASVIGAGTAHTPLLNVPLTGPAYLVSHGGAAFPDVEFLLQGEGVHITLDGKTDIKKGITYSHFETVPDAPISSFETVFPQGPGSIFGANVPQNANYSLCGQNLAIPTTLTGQNGAIVNQSTKLAITGCAKAKKKTLTRAQKLKAALKACRKKDKHSKHKREACERQAHRRYGPIKHSKKK